MPCVRTLCVEHGLRAVGEVDNVKSVRTNRLCHFANTQLSQFLAEHELPISGLLSSSVMACGLGQHTYVVTR